MPRNAALCSLRKLTVSRTLVVTLALSGVTIAGALPVAAQDVKELMGRSQTQSQQRAVEELIRKLQGGTAAKPDPVAPASPAAKPAGATPAVEAQPAAPVPEPPKVVVAPVAPPRQAPAGRPPEVDPMSTDPGRAPSVPPAPPARPAEPQRPEPAAPVRVPVPAAPAPAPAPAPVETARIDALPSIDIEVYFDYNSDVITAGAAGALSVLAEVITDPRLRSARFLIAGHTDAKGGAAYNVALSERRAAAVRRHLIEKFGIDGNRLVSQGFGSQRLKIPQRPMAVENRRVQVVNLSAPEVR